MYQDIAGITIKKVIGEDRPGHYVNDMVLDIILTVSPAKKETPIPVLHRKHIPHWTREQVATVGRYTTGPLFTHWTGICQLQEQKPVQCQNWTNTCWTDFCNSSDLIFLTFFTFLESKNV